jgi:hypothetical protein
VNRETTAAYYASSWQLLSPPRLASARLHMDQDLGAENPDDPLAPLLGLIGELRSGVTELQGRWEALGEELEAKRRRLRLAEATWELIRQRQGEDKTHAEDGMLDAENEDDVQVRVTSSAVEEPRACS